MSTKEVRELREADQFRSFDCRISDKFLSRISIDPEINRSLVSYQGNKSLPGFRWFKYKEGFSYALVDRFLEEHKPTCVLDPFSGIGTTPIAAARRGLIGIGVEIMPVGVRVAQAVVAATNLNSTKALQSTGREMLSRLNGHDLPSEEHWFPHVAITENAFSKETELELAKVREFLDQIEDTSLRSILDVACMTVLESASFTRKDGQYLRWDYRSGRQLRSKVDIGPVTPFRVALEQRIEDIVQDVTALHGKPGSKPPTLLTGSCLERLREFPNRSIDMVITSPPYANRYDYTRTYALELAWLGFEQNDFKDLRQMMLTATVENKSKEDWLRRVYRDDDSSLQCAKRIFQEQRILRSIIDSLVACEDELSNKNIIRLLEGYFFEMALVIVELGRIIKLGGTVIMVNDNVQYHGHEIPVDFILTEFAELCGFSCIDIWKLARGKGNSSQQMARFGRREIRKCVYRWQKVNE